MLSKVAVLLIIIMGMHIFPPSEEIRSPPHWTFRFCVPFGQYDQRTATGYWVATAAQGTYA